MVRARVFRRELIEQMAALNAHLSLIAEVIQQPEERPKSNEFHLSQIAKAIRERPAPNVLLTLGNAAQPFADAMELLARQLWINLPDESKEDLSP